MVVSAAVKGGRTKARNLRTSVGVPLDVPLPDVLGLAERSLGVPVAIFGRLGDDVAGAYISRGERRLIVLNGSDPAVRVRFTLAHELAHHCFGDDARPDTHAGLAVPGHWIEVRANAFAAELLMPHEAVLRWTDGRRLRPARLDDVVEAAAAFGVSALAACYRLQEAGVEFDARRLEREIAAGLHLTALMRREPYADPLLDALQRLPYVPQRLRGSVLFRTALGELPVAQAARRLGTTVAELRDAWAPLDLLPPA
jgi:Zn-dependent peptidase ImmA (M78 family)